MTSNPESGEPDHKGEIPTDGFSSWLDRTRKAQRTGAGASVPCGECRGCCTSSYFIHITPGETGTLAKIPKQLLFRAPGLPKGHLLMGYRENGHCPMLVDNQCSIYAHRPRTCRDYDCRIFPATGIPVEEGKPAIAGQAARWKFDMTTKRDHEHLAAVKAAARFLAGHAAYFPAGFIPPNPTQQAVLAIEVHEVFLAPAGVLERGASPDLIRERADAVVAAFKASGSR